MAFAGQCGNPLKIQELYKSEELIKCILYQVLLLAWPKEVNEDVGMALETMFLS